MDNSAEVVQLLDEWRRGDQAAYDRLIPLVYGELRRLAHGQLRRESPGHSLQPTLLVHEAYLRLADADAALARLVAGYQDVSALQIAQIHALRGEADEAMDWLDRAYQQRDTGLSQLKSTAYFDRLAGDPRYQAFLDKMHLPR